MQSIMASPGLLTLLRLLPFATSSCSLWFSLDQHFFLSIFLEPDNRAHSKPLVSRYFRSFFDRGAPRVVGLLALTTISIIASLRSASASFLHERGSYNWYVAGATFAASHLLFVPWIKPSIDGLRSGAKKNGSLELLTEWLRIHDYRTLSVDLAAWICCSVAVVRTFTP
ncbi:putative integral membrane protein [Hypoxylon sp. FL0890]|nr:putative integral membrane protein [Hypoxylon sp. FL0890]